jgi:hypothetical protein
MSRQYWVAPVPPLHSVSGAAFNTFTTLQSITPAPDIVIPANMLEVGSELHMEADGEFSNTGTPTLGLGFLLGATTLGLGYAADHDHHRCLLALARRGQHAGPRGRCLGCGVGARHGLVDARHLADGSSRSSRRCPRLPLPRGLHWYRHHGGERRQGRAVWGTSNVANTITVNRFAVDLRS